MTYKAVPGPKVISVGKDGNQAAATDLFAQIINAEATNGWTYHSMETITVQQQVGCANRDVANTSIYMLIFCREQ